MVRRNSNLQGRSISEGVIEGAVEEAREEEYSVKNRIPDSILADLNKTGIHLVDEPLSFVLSKSKRPSTSPQDWRLRVLVGVEDSRAVPTVVEKSQLNLLFKDRRVFNLPVFFHYSKSMLRLEFRNLELGVGVDVRRLLSLYDGSRFKPLAEDGSEGFYTNYGGSDRWESVTVNEWSSFQKSLGERYLPGASQEKKTQFSKLRLLLEKFDRGVVKTISFWENAAEVVNLGLFDVAELYPLVKAEFSVAECKQLHGLPLDLLIATAEAKMQERGLS